MGIFQGVNPQGLEAQRQTLLQRLQAQMGARQQGAHTMELLNRRNPGQRPPGFQQMPAGGVGGRPIGVGASRGSVGRQGITQNSNIAQSILSRLGAINPRALEGEASMAPGIGIPGGMLNPGHSGADPGMGSASAPSWGPSLGAVNAPGSGTGAAAPGGGTISGPNPGQTNAQGPLGPIPGLAADAPIISSNMNPQGNPNPDGLIHLGNGRYFDPATGSITTMPTISQGGRPTGLQA